MVSFGDQVSIENTFPEALATFFQQVNTGTGGGNGNGPGGNGNGQTNASAQQRLTQALDDASAAYKAGQAALAQGDFAGYGQAQQALQNALNRAQKAAQELGLRLPSGGATPPTSPSPSTTSTPASYFVQGARIPPIH